MRRGTDLEINKDLRLLAVSEGAMVRLTFKVHGESDIGPIEMSRAETIKAGGEIMTRGATDAIPIHFSPSDARAFGPWLMRFAADD